MCRFAGRGYSHGVFVGTEHGPIELTAYAEVVTIQRILCNLPNWQPGAIMIASQEIFINEKAERRELRFAVRLE